MTPEAKVKKKVVEVLKRYGAYYFQPVTGGFGRSGVPDLIACYRGKFIGIECKSGNKQPTALQQKNLDDIEKQGGISLLINEENIWVLDKQLAYLQGEAS
jgi:Holliday junction resolvase